MSTEATGLLRAQYKQSFEWLEGTMKGSTDDLVSYDPPGTPTPIGAQLAHILTGLDFFVLGQVVGKEPLMMSTFAENSGISEPPPQGGDWGDWGTRVKIDLPKIHEYGKAIFAEIDSYLASIEDTDLHKELDLGSFGKKPVSWVLNIMLLNTHCHTGEIACIKGLQGVKGYPM